MRMSLQQQVQVQSFCNTGNIKYVSFYYLKFHSLRTKTFNWFWVFFLSGCDGQCPDDHIKWEWELFSTLTKQLGSAQGQRAVMTCEEKWTHFTVWESDWVRALSALFIFTPVQKSSRSQCIVSNFLQKCFRLIWSWSCVLRIGLIVYMSVYTLKMWFWSTRETVQTFVYVQISYFFHWKFLDEYFCNA